MYMLRKIAWKRILKCLFLWIIIISNLYNFTCYLLKYFYTEQILLFVLILITSIIFSGYLIILF